MESLVQPKDGIVKPFIEVLCESEDLQKKIGDIFHDKLRNPITHDAYIKSDIVLSMHKEENRNIVGIYYDPEVVDQKIIAKVIGVD